MQFSKLSHTRVIQTLAVLFAISGTIFVLPALAAGNPYVTPSISLNPTNGPSGSTVTVTGTGFNPSVGITLHSSTGTITVTSGAITTSATGGFTATIVITAASAPVINIRASGSDQASIPRDTATAQFTVTNVQAGHSGNIKMSGGSGSRDDTAITGVSVSITGATGITNLNVTTSKLTGPGNGVVSVTTGGSVLYFDVNVALPSGTSAPSGATVQVCFTDPSVSSSDTLQFYSGGSWTTATGVTVTGTQVCGTVPLSALTGTNFAVYAAAGYDYTWVYITVIVVVLVVIVAVGVVMTRRRKT